MSFDEMTGAVSTCDADCNVIVSDRLGITSWRDAVDKTIAFLERGIALE